MVILMNHLMIFSVSLIAVKYGGPVLYSIEKRGGLRTVPYPLVLRKEEALELYPTLWY